MQEDADVLDELEDFEKRLEKRLEKMQNLMEHTNRVVRHMRREVIIVRSIRIILMVAFLIGLIWVYFYIQPYLQNLDSVFEVVNQYTPG